MLPLVKGRTGGLAGLKKAQAVRELRSLIEPIDLVFREGGIVGRSGEFMGFSLDYAAGIEGKSHNYMM